MKHKYTGLIGMCIMGVVLFQSTVVNASEVGSLDKSTVLEEKTVEGEADSVTKEAEEKAYSMAKAIGAASILEPSKTKEEYIEAVEVVKEANWGYANLAISNVSDNLNIRKLPEEGAGLVGKLPKDAACEVLKTEGDWSLVKSGEVEGYVKTEFLISGFQAKNRAQEVLNKVAVVNSDSLRVREEPNTDSEVVTMVPKGEELDVVDIADGWAKVMVDAEEDYVSLEHVRIEEKLVTAMTMSELLYGQGVSDIRVDLAEYAKQFIGNPYVWGGTSLTKGADCSGYVMSVFKKFGISLPRTSQTQANAGSRIAMSEAKPGDLIFYAKGGRINHVAIYIGGNQVVHASNPKTGIRISRYNYRTPERVVRVLPNN